MPIANVLEGSPSMRELSRQWTWSKSSETQNTGADKTRHDVYTRLEGGALFKAPIENPAKILDVGQGTGKWAM